jgi:hypothetical protein
MNSLKIKSFDNFNNRCLHHHVFDLEILRKMFEYFDSKIIYDEEISSDYISCMIFAFRLDNGKGVSRRRKHEKPVLQGFVHYRIAHHHAGGGFDLDSNNPPA